MKTTARWIALVVVLILVAIPTIATASDHLGNVSFPTSCSPAVQADFDRAVALLHSFWLDAAGKTFAAVSQADPGCAMAHWGTAMVKLGNPLAGARPRTVLEEGWAAIQRAKAANPQTPRERGYVEALESFYRDVEKADGEARRGAAAARAPASAQRPGSGRPRSRDQRRIEGDHPLNCEGP